MRPVPDFDEMVGSDLPEEERERLRRAHELLVQAGPPPELSPEMEAVPWPEEALMPLGLTRRPGKKRSPLLLAATVATAGLLGFVIGQASNSTSTSVDATRVVQLKGTDLASQGRGTLEIGDEDSHGNTPMVLHVTGLRSLPPGGYYDLFLSRNGKPIALCGTFNVRRGETVVRMNAAYELGKFDGWIVTRQQPGQHEPKDIVLRPTGEENA
jgi:anti-sigma-K factor RskA